MAEGARQSGTGLGNTYGQAKSGAGTFRKKVEKKATRQSADDGAEITIVKRGRKSQPTQDREPGGGR